MVVLLADCSVSCVVVSGRSMLPDPDSVMESDGYDVSDGQVLMGRLQWDGSSDISPSDSASSKASEFRGSASTVRNSLL